MIVNLSIADLDDLSNVFYNSFSGEEAPSILKLISDIMHEEFNSDSICLGYRAGQNIVGAVALSPVFFNQSANLSGYILAPLAVHRSFQNVGIARKLIEEAKVLLIHKEVDVLLVYGDPNFYGRFGFRAELGRLFVPPYKLEFEFGWQAMLLNPMKTANIKHHFNCVNALQDPSLW